MVPKIGASLSCRPLSFVLSSCRLSNTTRDAVCSCRKIERWLQKDASTARGKGARLAQQDDPHVSKKPQTARVASCQSFGQVT